MGNVFPIFVQIIAIGINSTVLLNHYLEKHMAMKYNHFLLTVFTMFIATFIHVQSTYAQCNIQTDFTFTPNNSASGTAITFQSSVQNAQGTVTYSWDFGDTTSQATAANPVHTYTYTGCQPITYNVSLTVTDTAGCTATQTHQVTVNNNPLLEMIDLDPISSFSNCENSPSLSNPSFTLDLQNGTQNPGSIASYQFDWGDGQNDNYTNSDFPVSHTYNSLGLFSLTVTATDTNGCVWDTTYMVSNQSNPAIGLSTMGYTQGCAPQTFQFVMSQYANNPPGTYYVWDFGDGSPTITWGYNQPFINDTITHTFDSTSCYQNNNYFTVQVTAYNTCDYTTATVSNIRIYLPPDPDIELLNDTVCAGDPVTFYNQTIPGFGYSCNQIAAYNWNFGDSLSSNNTSSLQTPTHTYTQAGTYQIILQADNGICGVEEDTVELVVIEPPHAIIDPDTSEICINGTINFTNLSTGTNPDYQWSISPGSGYNVTSGSMTDSNLTVQFTQEGSYDITLTASNMCSSDDTTVTIHVNDAPEVTLDPIANFCGTATVNPTAHYNDHGTPIHTYTWTMNGGNPSTSSNSQPGSVTYSSPGTYTIYVQAENNCGTAIDSVTFTVYELPDVIATATEDTICKGATTTLNATGAIAYSWSPSTKLSNPGQSTTNATPDNSTQYIVTGTDQNGCVNTDTLNIHVNPLPNIDIDAIPGTICQGDTATIQASGGTSYSWNLSTTYNQLNDSTIEISPLTNTQVIVTGTDSNGCSLQDSTMVYVNPTPHLTFSPTNPDICIGDTISISVTGASVYEWYNNGTLVANGGSVQLSPSSTTTYTVLGTDIHGCQTVDSITVTVNNLPNVSMTLGADSICNGQSTNLTATGASSYIWTPASSLNSSTGSTVTASPGITTTYTVTGIDNNGCQASDTGTVVVLDAPNIQVIQPQDICIGDSVMLTASSSVNLTWSPTTGLNTSSGDTVIASPATTTTYSVSGSNSIGCQTTVTTSVTVHQLPSLSFTPSNPEICLNDSVAITVSGADTYVWSPAQGLSSATGSNVVASPSNSTIYEVTGSDIHGCSTMDSIEVTVHQLPSVSIDANPSNICEGEFVQLSANQNNMSWSDDNGNSWGSGQPLTIQPVNSGTFYGLYTDTNGCQAIDSTNINVSPKPVLSYSLSKPSICLNDSLTITMSGAATYDWYIGNTNLPFTGASATVSPSSNTTYTVIGTSANGCLDTIDIPVTVNPLPVVAPSAANHDICTGDSVMLSASGANTYTWSPATSLNQNTGSNVMASPAATTTYTIVGTDINGCSADTTTTVTVNPLPVVDAQASVNEICPGGSTQLTATGAQAYNWSPATGLSSTTGNTVTASPATTTTYYATGISADGCEATDSVEIIVHPKPNLTYSLSQPSICNNDSLTITMSGAATYDWYIGNTNLPFTGASATVSPSSNTTYTVIGTSANGCLDTIDIPVTVNPLPVVAPSAANHDICTGDSVMLSASGANTYTWSPATSLNQNTGSNVMASPAATTTYTIVGTDINGCSADTTTTVTVNPLPVVDAQASVNEICPGGSTQLTATGAQAYNWSPATGLSSTTGNTVTASPATTTTYYATGISADGCEATDSVEIIVHPKPNLTYSLSQPSICNNDSLTITMSGAATYDWYIGNTNLPFTGASATVSPSSNTTYTVIGTSANGCLDTIDIPVTVNPLPVVAPSAANHDICTGDSVMLSASGANTYTWSPATSLNQNTGSNVMASPAATTTYTIVGTDINGCSADTTTTVTVNPLPVINLQASDTSICLGQSVQIVAQGAQNYTWSPSASLNTTTNDTVIATPTSTTTYQVAGINSNGCENTSNITIHVHQAGPLTATPPSASICAGDTTTLSVSGAVTYTWINTPGLLQSNGGQAQVSPASTTTYHVTGIDSNGCIRDVDIPVTVNPLPTVDANSNIASVCLGDTASLWGTGASNYDWYNNGNFIGSQNPISVNPVSTTTYYVEGTDVNGCSNIDSVEIVVNDLPNISVTLSDTAICLGDTAQATASGATTYSWQSSSTFTQLAGNMIELSPASNTQIIVQGTDQNGCSNSDSSVLHINQPPVLTFTPTSPQICNGDTIQLGVSGAVNYDWYKQGQFIGNGSNVTVSPSGNTFYTVIATDANGCQSIDSVMVEVIALPQLSLSATNDSICAGQTSTISVTGASSYIWNPSASLNTSTGSTVQATPATTTTYYVEGSNAQGCKTTDSIDITVVPLPVLQVSPTADICQGDSATLTASGASVITWSPATGLSQTTGGQVIANPSSTTTYTVTGYNDFGCVDTATVTVNVHNIPNIALTPTNPQLCLGDSIQLNANGANTYTWTPSATLSSSTGASVLASPSTSTTYQVTGTTIHGCSNQNTITVDVIPTPNVSVSATPANVCQGSTVQLNSTESNTSWSNSQGVYIGSGLNMTILPTASETYYGTYTDVHGCHAIDSVQVNVSPTPSLSYSMNKPYTCQGDSILIEVTGATNYTWYAGTTNLNIADSSAYLTPATSMTYTIVGENNAGCTDTIDIPVSVQSLPTIHPLTASADICPGDTALLSVSGANTYTWTPATGLSQTFGNTVFSSPVTTTNYTVEGTDIFGCKADTTIAVNVKPHPNIQVQASDTVICLGQSVTLTASGGQSYHWTPANSLNQNFGDTVQASPASTTTYYVTGTNSTGCTTTKSITIHVNIGSQLTVTPATSDICLGDTTTITVNGAVSYSWASNSGIVQINNNAATVSPSATTTYQVTGIDSLGCTHTLSIPVHVNMPPVVTANTTSATLCQGDSIQVWASGAQNYQWFANGNYISNQTIFTDKPLSATTYTVTGVDSNGCSSTASVNVNVNPIPSLSLSLSDSAICLGNSATLTASGGLNYNWTPSSTLNSATGTSVIATPSIGTTYHVTATSVHGCTAKDSVFLDVMPLPNVQLTAHPTNICKGDTVSLTASGAVNYNWNSNQLNTATVYETPDTTFTYTITGTDNNGCSNQASQTIIVNPQPIPNFITDTIICKGTNLAINNTSVNASSFIWDFGDGTTSTASNPTHTYSSTGFYDIRLLATTAGGCQDSTLKTVQVIDKPDVNYALSQDSGCAPLNVQFNNMSSGVNTSYTWNFGNGTSSGSYSPSMITYPGSQYGDTSYVVSLTGANKCGFESQYDTILVQNKPEASFSLTPDQGCSPLNVTFTNTSQGNPQAFAWDFGDGTTSGSANPGSHHYYNNGLNDTTYLVTLIAYNSCGTDTSHATVEVSPQTAFADYTPSTLNGCAPLTVDFNNLSTGGTNMYWDFDDGNISNQTNPTHTFSLPGSYNVKLVVYDSCSTDSMIKTINVSPSPFADFMMNKDTICTGGHISFTNMSVNAVNVTWKFGDGTISHLTNPVHQYTQSGLYFVTMIMTEQGTMCQDSVTKPVFVSPTPEAGFATSALSGCSPLDVQLSDTSQGAQYYYYQYNGTGSNLPSPAATFNQPGTYTVWQTVENSFGCVDSTSIDITVHPTPVSDFSLPQTLACDTPATMMINNQSIGAVSYNWDFNNGNTSTIQHPVVTYHDPGTYTISLIATNNYLCSDTSYKNFKVSEPIEPMIGLSTNDGCEPLNVQFANKSGNSVKSTLWNFGDSCISSKSNPTHIYQAPGSYSVQLVTTNTDGCKDTLLFKDTIDVYPQPDVGFNYTFSNNPTPTSGFVEFTGYSPTATNWFWDFDDGATANTQNPVHQFSGMGIYNVLLSVTNQYGCTNDTTGQIKLDAVHGLYVPNALSPRSMHEGVKNFKPKGKGISRFWIGIYDKWGNVVWESTELDNGQPAEGWDGTRNGKMLPAGVYVWKVEAVFEDGSVWRGMKGEDGVYRPYGQLRLIR